LGWSAEVVRRRVREQGKRTKKKRQVKKKKKECGGRKGGLARRNRTQNFTTGAIKHHKGLMKNPKTKTQENYGSLGSEQGVTY